MLLFDENLSYKLCILIKDIFPNCQHIRDFQLLSASDSDIWTCAIENKLAIVTQDFDFLNKSTIHGHPPKVIHLATGNSSTRQILELLTTNQQKIQSFLKNVEQSYLIIN